MAESLARASALPGRATVAVGGAGRPSYKPSVALAMMFLWISLEPA